MIEPAISHAASESIPEIVYHYTSMSTMLKIVETRQMRATSIRYLNDTLERDGLLKKAVKLMPKLSSDPTLEVEAFSDYLQDGIIPQDVTSIPFVASFSAHDDSLPQWRSYCPQGNGISIGFDVKCLKAAKVHGDTSLSSKGTTWDLPFPIKFAAVRYYSPTKQDEIEAAVREVYKRAYDWPERLSKDQDTPDIPLSQAFRFMLEDEAATYKDAAFASEVEFRLLLGGVYWKPNLMRFRSNRSTLVPFVEFDIPNQEGVIDKASTWDAIRCVTVGPSVNSGLTTEALNAFFHSVGMKVTVSQTVVPYRDW